MRTGREGTAAMIRVLLADDHEAVRLGVTSFLSACADIEVVGAVGNGAAALSLIATLAPDVVLMDLSMPVMDGIEATRQIHALSPHTPVIVLTVSGDHDRVSAAVEAGASGYIVKGSDPEELAVGIRAAVRGGQAFCAEANRARFPE